MKALNAEEGHTVYFNIKITQVPETLGTVLDTFKSTNGIYNLLL